MFPSICDGIWTCRRRVTGAQLMCGFSCYSDFCQEFPCFACGDVMTGGLGVSAFTVLISLLVFCAERFCWEVSVLFFFSTESTRTGLGGKYCRTQVCSSWLLSNPSFLRMQRKSWVQPIQDFNGSPLRVCSQSLCSWDLIVVLHCGFQTCSEHYYEVL